MKMALTLRRELDTPPDDLVTALAVECNAPPVVDHHSIRPLWPRYIVGISSNP